MDNKKTAKEIYNYMVQCLAHGVYISKTNEKEMIKEIQFFIETD